MSEIKLQAIKALNPDRFLLWHKVEPRKLGQLFHSPQQPGDVLTNRHGNWHAFPCSNRLVLVTQLGNLPYRVLRRFSVACVRELFDSLAIRNRLLDPRLMPYLERIEQLVAEEKISEGVRAAMYQELRNLSARSEGEIYEQLAILSSVVARDANLAALLTAGSLYHIEHNTMHMDNVTCRHQLNLCCEVLATLLERDGQKEKRKKEATEDSSAETVSPETRDDPLIDGD